MRSQVKVSFHSTILYNPQRPEKGGGGSASSPRVAFFLFYSDREGEKILERNESGEESKKEKRVVWRELLALARRRCETNRHEKFSQSSFLFFLLFFLFQQDMCVCVCVCKGG